MRPSIDQTYIEIIKIIAKRSTCCRIKTGCVIVRDTHIISTGYNGVLKNIRHCDEHWREYHKTSNNLKPFDEWIHTDEFKTLHREYSRLNELHAERNAILFSAKEGISTKNAIIYTLYSPCIDCATSIYGAGIVKVIYVHDYDRDNGVGLRFLREAGIECIKYVERE